MLALLLMAALQAAPARPAEPEPAPVPVLQATELRRLPAPEARQGAAVDARHVYAVNNNSIGKYDKRTGAKVGAWAGARSLFPHINSCGVLAAELVCAHSNYPRIPMASSVEVFDPRAMTHKRSLSLGVGYGSLTWLDRREGAWWAGFANYDGRGGEPGRDHRFTSVVRFDDRFRATGSWIFPETVLERFKPSSSSGGAWGPDGLLYVTGHDAPEIYALRLPKAGSTLEHVATVKVSFAGQAFAFDPGAPRVVWGVDRASLELVAVRLPDLRPAR